MVQYFLYICSQENHCTRKGTELSISDFHDFTAFRTSSDLCRALLQLFSQELIYLLVHNTVIQGPVCALCFNAVIRRKIRQPVMMQCREACLCKTECIHIIIIRYLPEKVSAVPVNKSHIKGTDIMTCQDPFSRKRKKFRQNLCKFRCILHHVIRNMIDLTGTKWNGPARIDKRCKLVNDLSAFYLHRRDFDHIVRRYGYSRCFQIEDTIIRYIFIYLLSLLI